MKSNYIRAYDDSLLSKERSIKSAVIVINIFTALAIGVGIIFPFWRIFKRPTDMELFVNCVDDVYRTLGWLIVLILLNKLNGNHLNHIASIKLYRNEDLPNQNLEPIVKTPVDKVEAQSTQAHV